MLPFLVDALELDKDFVSPPLSFDSVRVDRIHNGVRVQVLEPKLSDPNALKKFDARDFQLQEILESGAFDLLVPTSPLPLSRLASLESAERASSELDAYVAKLQQSVEVVEPSNPVE